MNEVGKDFRANLFSIFIDNLNPNVDVAFLWSVFKVFGRVRDVFLSSKFSSRKSCYAFNRFDSMEEASKVAKSVDGIHVYGWPIRVNLAEIGWNNQRSSQVGKKGAKKDGLTDVGRARIQRSFAEVVKGSQIGLLENTGARKSPGKSILWSFESKVEKDGFIKNRFFWGNCFSSMSSWSDHWAPKGKLEQIIAHGVPMNCWDDAFFLKLGRHIGDSLWVDEETSFRKRLDRGSFLAPIPNDCSNFFSIKVSMEDLSFTVKMEVDPKPVSQSWLTHFLGLKNNLITPAPPSAMEGFEKSSYASSDGEFREVKGRDGGALRCQSLIAVRIGKGYPTFQSLHRKGFEIKGKGSSDVRGLLPKAVAFQNPKEYLLYYQNSKLEIGRMEG
ncbi:hypothetical protein Ddye_028427 [Dipteronia dyeriana]|uniref:RRM domain-containing protein n=1 Tax=Dipteronia dyeriana TaxID=168575 RepID=A0AAD9TRG2_9ROSI|nr:hypothetical protein Ddye_028427 [Dipteronia dyeriana]